MFSWFERQNWIWLGWLSVWVMLGGILVILGVNILALVRQVDLPQHLLKPVQDIFSYTLSFVFILGLRSYAIRKADETLISLFNTFLCVDIVMSILLLPGSFPRLFSEEFISLTLIASLPLLCVLGIVLYRIAIRFNTHIAELGDLGKRIVWWNKVAGWTIASIILMIPGLFFYLIGLFFFWRLLARESKTILS